MKEVLAKRGSSRAAAGQPEQGPRFSTSVLEKAGFSVIVTDLAGKITYWNKGAEEMRGWKSEEVLGKPIFDVLPPESRELAEAVMKGVAQSGWWEGEFVAMRKDGARFQTLSNDAAVEDRNGHVTGIVDVSTDITERRQLEKSLRQSEERFRGIAERSFDGIFTADSKGVYTYVSPAFAKLFGLDPSEMTGKSILERAHLRLESESQQDNFVESFKEVLKGKVVEAGEFEITRADGSLAVIEANASPIFEGEKVTGVQAVVRNVTERKESERKLRESEEKFKGIAERSFDGLFTIDSEGNTTYVSPSLFRLTGFTPEELEGLALLKFIPESSISKVVEAMAKVLEGQTINNFEVEGRRKDGSSLMLEVNAAPVFGLEHSVTAIQGVVRDVTRRNESEKRLRLLASVVEASPLGVLTLGMDGSILSWNRAAGEIYGYSSTETIGQNITFLNGDGVSSAFPDIVEALKKGGGDAHFEGVRLKKDGSLFPISADAFRVRDASGETVAISTFFSDITVQKAAEEKVRDLQEARSKFISAATHELKTPLVSIKGYSDLAASGSLGEVPKPLEHGLTVVSRNVDRMLNLIQELLEIERTDNGKVEISKEVVDLTDLIRVSIENLRPIAEGKSLEVDAILPESEIHVLGDHKRLAQVVDNLLVNAIKFTPSKGKIRVEVTEEAGEVRVCVADTGIGVSPTNLLHLFEPFSKIPKAQSTENQAFGMQSTGLGLAVTKGFVELHGGRIWAESPGEGKGSTFVFTLPSISQ
jgi:PAS domain S-box-containing protein